MNNFSENLKKIRKDNNLSQEQLADLLNGSRQAISKWESSTAYPEMEKIILICKKFNVNIDDLLNKDIKEINSEIESKKNINNYIERLLNFVSDTVNLIIKMSFKTKLKFIIEEFVIASILVILSLIIGRIGESFVSSLFSIFGNKVYSVIYNVLFSAYIVLMFIISLTIIVYIFKNRYLNYYKNIKEEKHDSKENNDNINKEIEIKKENNIIIRDPKNSEFNFIKSITKIIILCIKTFTLFITLGLCLMLIGETSGFVISFMLYKTGLFFVGLLILFIGLILGTLIVALFLFNFIFNRKNNKKVMIWTFISSMIIFGLGCGFSFLGILNFKTGKLDNNELYTNKIYIDMRDNLIIDNEFINANDSFDLDNKIEYIEKDIDNIEIEYTSNYKSTDLYPNYYKINGYYIFYSIPYSSNEFELFKTIVKELNENKRIVDDVITINSLKIYTSKDNISKIKKNIENYYK